MAASTPAALASRLSSELFPRGAPVAYVVDAGDVAAAVLASAVAASKGGPVLLSEADGAGDATLDELERLQPRDVFVVGVAAERDAVTEALRAVVDAVHQLGGADPHATASAVASEAVPDARIVYLLRPPTTDGTVADALATAPVAGTRGAAILWIDDTIAVNTLRELDVLRPQHMVLVGSTAGLSSDTREQPRKSSIAMADPSAARLQAASGGRPAASATGPMSMAS